MQVQQGLVLALAHCLSISINADLQQQVIDEVLRDLVPACQHLHALYHSPGLSQQKRHAATGLLLTTCLPL